MENFLREWEPPMEISSDTVIWEWLKQEVKSFTRRFMKTQKNEEIRHLQDLEKELLLLVGRRDGGQPDLNFPIDSLVRQIKEIEERRARRTIFQSRANWSLYGEKPTKYFLNLQNRRRRETLISTVIGNDGQQITDHREILKEGRKFYENLYESREDEQTPLLEIEEEIDSFNLPQLSPEGRLALDSPLCSEELREAAGKLNHNKCPGTDGLPPRILSEVLGFVGPVPP